MSDRAGLEYDAKISISYHRKREHFYRTIDAIGKAVSLIALALIGVHVNSLTIGIAIVSGAFTIATIVFDCAGMAAKHGGLAARFTTLLSKIVSSQDTEMPNLRREYHIIEADEPPQIRGLVQICQDEQDAADGKRVDFSRFSFRRLICAQFGFGEKPIDWT